MFGTNNGGTAIMDARIKRLRTYNLVMGVFHLVQAILMFLLSSDFSLPVKSSFLHYMAARDVLEPISETIIDLRIGPLVAMFLLISAIAHFAIASPWVFKWYARNLKEGINYARWYEYALSASLMIVVIAMLSGIYDIVSLIALFSLTATMNLFGLLMELHNQTTRRTNWTSYVFGCFAGIVPWIATAIYFFGSAATGEMPTFVYFILGSIFFLFFSFAVNMLLQYRKVGPWRDYLFGERVYVLLSLVAKSALAWQVFGGTLERAAY
jgi:hypothetical protein